MKRKQSKLFEYSAGERGIYTAYTIIALFGAGLSFFVINQLGGQTEIIRSLKPYDFWSIFAGAVGAGGGLYIGRRWLGKSGISGFICAVAGVPVISFIGALIAGTLALPIYGTMFGPMALAGTFYENSFLFFLWTFTILIAHHLFGIYRKERDSVFASSEDAGFSA